MSCTEHVVGSLGSTIAGIPEFTTKEIAQLARVVCASRQRFIVFVNSDALPVRDLGQVFRMSYGMSELLASFAEMRIRRGLAEE